MGGEVAVAAKGDRVIHKVLYTSSIAFHSSGTTAVLLLLDYQETRCWRGLQMYHATKMTMCSI